MRATGSQRLGHGVDDNEFVFTDFDEWDAEVSVGVVLHGRSGGEGPPVLLLHGHPRTHTTWRRVAPILVAAGFTVVCPDLPGYGRSFKPVPTLDHAAHSKRRMGVDVLGLMQLFGHRRFAVVGHEENYRDLQHAIHDPATVRAMLEDYRAGLGVDRSTSR